MVEYRDQQRIEMLYKTARDKRGHPLCHLCNLIPGSQMHELVNRAQTSCKLIFRKELCSWLCPECHERAPLFESEQALWARNIRVYGLWEVQKRIKELELAIGFDLGIILPEVNDGR